MHFPENFRCNLKYNKRENFSDSSVHHIFESEKFKFPFFTKHGLIWAVKCEKLTLQKIVGNLLREKPRELYMNGKVI